MSAEDREKIRDQPEGARSSKTAQAIVEDAGRNTSEGEKNRRNALQPEWESRGTNTTKRRLGSKCHISGTVPHSTEKKDLT